MPFTYAKTFWRRRKAALTTSDTWDRHGAGRAALSIQWQRASHGRRPYYKLRMKAAALFACLWPVAAWRAATITLYRPACHLPLRAGHLT